MYIAALDGAVLMGDAAVVAGWNHAIMLDERGIATRDILSRISCQTLLRKWTSNSTG